MRIVFFGSPASALPSLARVLRDGHRVELVITQPDRPSGRGKTLTACPVKRFALERGLPVHQPEKIRKDPRCLELLQGIQPDINVVVAFGQIMPDSVIYLPRLHSVNVHFSLLPKFRGASPVAWALLQGETKTGITIFELNEKMDEGDILTTERSKSGRPRPPAPWRTAWRRRARTFCPKPWPGGNPSLSSLRTTAPPRMLPSLRKKTVGSIGPSRPRSSTGGSGPSRLDRRPSPFFAASACRSFKEGPCRTRPKRTGLEKSYPSARTACRSSAARPECTSSSG